MMLRLASNIERPKLSAASRVVRTFTVIGLFVCAQFIAAAHGFDPASSLDQHHSTDCIACLAGDRAADTPEALDVDRPIAVFGRVTPPPLATAQLEQAFSWASPARAPPTL